MAKELLLELSYFDLEGRTKQTFGNERKDKSNRVQSYNLIFIPMEANNKLKVVANTQTSSKHTYNSNILFDNVHYLDGEQPNMFTFKGNDNSQYIINKLPKGNNVKVNCSCLDFYYRFSTWDDRFKSLDGNPPPPYIKKTNKPEVNPMKSPGVCKHIMRLMDELQNQGIFL